MRILSPISNSFWSRSRSPRRMRPRPPARTSIEESRQILLDLLPNSTIPWGLRTVDGSLNNLVPGQEYFGAAGQQFPQMLDPVLPGHPGAEPGRPGGWTGSGLLRAGRRQRRTWHGRSRRRVRPVRAPDQQPDRRPDRQQPGRGCGRGGNDGATIVTEPRPRRRVRHRRRHRSLLHPQRDAGRRPVGAVQLVDDAVRPVLRPRPRPRQQGRQRHGLHPAAAGRPAVSVRGQPRPTSWC